MVDVCGGYVLSEGFNAKFETSTSGHRTAQVAKHIPMAFTYDLTVTSFFQPLFFSQAEKNS